MVLDMSSFTAIALELAYQEFKQKYVAVNASKIDNYLAASGSVGVEEEKKEPAAAAAGNSKFYKKEQELPIITSECPGWVCYAEKRVGDLALPFMSRTKSPQQLCGILSKLYLAKIHHVGDRFLAKKQQAEADDANVSEMTAPVTIESVC